MSSLSTSSSLPAASAADVSRGLLLGAAGVVMFALSLPMTRLAGGSAAARRLPDHQCQRPIAGCKP